MLFNREFIREVGAVTWLRRTAVLTEAQPLDELFDFTEPLDYGVFAFVRNSGALYLTELGRKNLGLTKMLFLVPPELRRRFS
jgi:hypothetical protein